MFSSQQGIKYFIATFLRTESLCQFKLTFRNTQDKVDRGDSVSNALRERVKTKYTRKLVLNCFGTADVCTKHKTIFITNLFPQRTV